MQTSLNAEGAEEGHLIVYWGKAGLQVAHVATFITCVVDPLLALVNKRLREVFNINMENVYDFCY